MKKLIFALVISIVMPVAVIYFTGVIKGEMSVKVLTVQRYYSGGGFDELIAIVKNTGEENATISGYEVFGRIGGGLGRKWDQTSAGDLQLSLEPGETRDISLGSSSISSTSRTFKVRIYVDRAAGGRYTITWESSGGGHILLQSQNQLHQDKTPLQYNGEI